MFSTTDQGIERIDAMAFLSLLVPIGSCSVLWLMGVNGLMPWRKKMAQFSIRLTRAVIPNNENFPTHQSVQSPDPLYFVGVNGIMFSTLVHRSERIVGEAC
ncbi:MAG: hypothetical protein DRR00_08810 [Candidatus Parabeggiatoa sp. nov. 3]|nr:MAG: hypothetical protein DRR00_08810 [Gammaproteobacteria bacterium]RKZ67776.1 MAG: hypothetical protein DRQ99_05785 [Gammaproteobacteria bacterium]